MRVRFTPAARRYLVGIARFIAADNPHRAESFVHELVAACEALGEYPERHVVLSRHIAQGYRRLPFGHYSIIYRVADEVQVVRIVSSWIDLEAELD